MSSTGIARTQGDYPTKRRKTPMECSLLFPDKEAMGFIRQLVKAGLQQKNQFYGRSEKSIIKGAFHKLDKFLMATERGLERGFSEIMGELNS